MSSVHMDIHCRCGGTASNFFETRSTSEVSICPMCGLVDFHDYKTGVSKKQGGIGTIHFFHKNGGRSALSGRNHRQSERVWANAQAKLSKPSRRKQGPRCALKLTKQPHGQWTAQLKTAQGVQSSLKLHAWQLKKLTYEGGFYRALKNLGKSNCQIVPSAVVTYRDKLETMAFRQRMTTQACVSMDWEFEADEALESVPF